MSTNVVSLDIKLSVNLLNNYLSIAKNAPHFLHAISSDRASLDTEGLITNLNISAYTRPREG